MLRRLQMLMLLTVLTVLASCAKLPFAYNHASWVMVPKLKAVTHFTSAQEQQIDVEFDRYMAWHRRTMLPQYARLLRATAELARPDVTAPQVAAHRQAWMRMWQSTVQPAMPVMAKVLNQLNPSQIEDMRVHFAEEMTDARKKLGRKTRRERQDARDDKFIDMLDDWTGGLRSAQEDTLRPVVARIPLQDAAFLAEQQRMRDQLVETLAARAGESRIVDVLDAAWVGRRAAATAEVGPAFDQFVVAAVQVLDAGQRARLQQQFSQWARDCEQLARQ